MSVLLKSFVPLPQFGQGKVRDTYDLDGKLLIVSTDRVSAFDVILPCGIPDKGVVLNKISAFWFDMTSHLVPNHVIEVLTSADAIKKHLPASSSDELLAQLAHRSMIVKKAQVIPVECVVRGYIAGSAWGDYRQSGSVNGMALPRGLRECQQLPEPLFTPTTKADSGHDMPMTLSELENEVGNTRAKQLGETSIALYQFAAEKALSTGIIIADTKMEFGLIDDKLILVDELFTPDSSRFWYAKDYEAGHSQASYDKQIVRDWLIEYGWNKEPPVPMLSEDIIEKTAERYRQIYRQLTGTDLFDHNS